MAEKKKILYIVEAMGGGVFTYIVDLANELVNKYDMYIAYAPDNAPAHSRTPSASSVLSSWRLIRINGLSK